MEIVGKVAATIQNVLGPEAEELGRATGVIQRRRKFTAVSLLRMLFDDSQVFVHTLEPVGVRCLVDVGLNGQHGLRPATGKIGQLRFAPPHPPII